MQCHELLADDQTYQAIIDYLSKCQDEIDVAIQKLMQPMIEESNGEISQKCFESHLGVIFNSMTSIRLYMVYQQNKEHSQIDAEFKLSPIKVSVRDFNRKEDNKGSDILLHRERRKEEEPQNNSEDPETVA